MKRSNVKYVPANKCFNFPGSPLLVAKWHGVSPHTAPGLRRADANEVEIETGVLVRLLLSLLLSLLLLNVPLENSNLFVSPPSPPSLDSLDSPDPRVEPRYDLFDPLLSTMRSTCLKNWN